MSGPLKSRPGVWRLTVGIGVWLCTGFAPGVNAADAAVEGKPPLSYTNAGDRFGITLPPGWKAMPSVLAEGLVDPVLAAKPGGVGSYGFEPAANSNSLTPPYVTVQVVRAGRMADGYVRLLRNPEIRRRAVLDLVRKDGLRENDIVSVAFETNRHRLRFCARHTDEFGGRVRLWHEMIFTESGTINVSCVADDADDADAGESPPWADVLTGVLDSVIIHSASAYQPRDSAPNVEGAKFRAGKVLLIPGLMIVVGLARLLSHRFSDRVMSDEI